MDSLLFLVTLHNVSRIPREVSQIPSSRGVKFSVHVNAVPRKHNNLLGPSSSSSSSFGGGDSLAATCPEVYATFEPRDLKPVPPDCFEVSLDNTSRSGRASMEWRVPRSTNQNKSNGSSSIRSSSVGEAVIDLLVTIKEEDDAAAAALSNYNNKYESGATSPTANRAAAGGGKVIAAGPLLTLDVGQLVTERKLRTFIVGTSFGHVGISVAVAPSDTAGYRQRLEQFLQLHNPSSLSKVANVVASIGEVEAFTTVYKKYRVVDYPARVTRFFRTYGPEYLDQVDTILKDWEKREEELIRTLILDNGPELCDIELLPRLQAFAKRYKLSPPEFDVTQMVESLAGKPVEEIERVMDGLAAKYGPEPYPRVYMFPPCKYPTNLVTASSSPSSSSGAAGAAAAPPAVSMSSSTTAAAAAANDSSMVPSPTSTDYTSQNYTTASKRSNSSYAATQPPPHQPSSSSFRSLPSGGDAAAGENGRGPSTNPWSQEEQQQPSQRSRSSLAPSQQQQQQQPYPTSHHQQQNKGGSSSSSVVELWSGLVEDLRAANIPTAELHFINESSFGSLLTELGYHGVQRQALVTEWNRRVAAALRFEPLTAGDPMFEAAKRDVITISGMHPLNISVAGVTVLHNVEHESSFSLRLQDAKLRATERLLLIGDHAKLLGFATHGVSQQPQLGGDHGLPAATFARRPFASYVRPTSLSVLVCDVIIGKPYMAPSSSSADHGSGASTAAEGTASFLRDYDSCLFQDSIHGASVAVYHPQQVLPKYLVQCNVDAGLTPCPAHPSKAVEFFVVESHVFACSQCVVMGQYRGKDVITVDDALLQARSQMQELQREVLQVVSEMAATEADCDRQLGALPQSDLRQQALRQIESIRREAEQKIAAIQLSLDTQERVEKDRILDVKRQSKHLLDDAQSVAQSLEDGMRLRNGLTGVSPSDLMTLLLKTKRSGIIESVKERAAEVRRRGNGGDAAAAGVPDDEAAPHHQRTLLQPTPTPFWGNSSHAAATPSSSRQPQPHHNHHEVRTPVTDFGGNSSHYNNNNSNASLYAKFLRAKEQQLQQNPMQSSSTPSGAILADPDAPFRSSVRDSTKAALDADAKKTKEMVTAGWALFRRGDRQGAYRTWLDVYERNRSNPTGARAKAYIAEALERNYAEAADWYEKALAMDRQDCLTLYNYGVLLESVMNRRSEALELFDAAAKLGDHAAARRAAQLRQSM